MDDKKKGGGSSKARRPMSMSERLGTMRMWQLVLMLVIVIGGALLLVGAASGWFDNEKVFIDIENRCDKECENYVLDLDDEEYKKLIENQKSAVILVDQQGCTTADRLEEYLLAFAKEKGFRFYRMMFSDVKETSLHDSVKYYPSVVIISKGRILNFLRADNDDDTLKFNDYDAFQKWIQMFF